MTHDKEHSHPGDLNCLEELELLYTYLDGELKDPETIARFEHHLAHCRNCFTRKEFEGAITDRIRKSAQGRVPSSLQQRLRDLVDKF